MILAPEADGTLHLPLPRELRGGNVKVEATLEPVESQPAGYSESLKGFGALKGEIWLAPDFDAPLDDFAEYMA
jgi:hypothetical protein